MGYYTDYDLSYELPPAKENPEIKAFKELCKEKGIPMPLEVQAKIDEQLMFEMQVEDIMTGTTDSGYSLKGFISGYEDTCKWYEHEKELREISAKIPGVIITLEGKGEEQGDHWIKYFMNGKMQYCPAKVTFDDFDMDKLK